MIYQYPTYYYDFQCINKNCPDTCCGGWNISIDSESLKRYRRILRNFHKSTHNTPSHSTLSHNFSSPHPSKAFLCHFRKAIDFHHSAIRLSDRFCPLLTNENLCGMYLHLGKDSLCKTCRTYPRHQEELGSLREISLSLSCPEAARIILSQKTRPQMQARCTSKPCPLDQQVEENVLAWLLKAREALLDVLWKPGRSLETSISMTLAFSHDLQRRHSKGLFYQNGQFCLETACKDLDHLSHKYLSDHSTQRFIHKLYKKLKAASPESKPKSGSHSFQAWISSFLKLYSSLEPVVEIWPQLMRLCQNSLIPGNTTSRCLSQTTAFQTEFAQIPEKQLLTYFIQVYFPGSVYDDNLFDKVQFAVISWLAIRLLAHSLALQNGVQQVTSTTDSSFHSYLIQAAYLYSRQVENYDQNLCALFDGLHTQKYFHLIPFLSFLNACQPALHQPATRSKKRRRSL